MTEGESPRTRYGALLVLLATFVLGMIAGGALLHIARLPFHPPPPGGPPPPGHPLRVLEHELDLSREQVEKLRAILDESREHMRAEADATRDRIREVLSPEQRERFDRMRPPRPPFPGPPPPPQPQE